VAFDVWRQPVVFTASSSRLSSGLIARVIVDAVGDFPNEVSVNIKRAHTRAVRTARGTHVATYIAHGVVDLLSEPARVDNNSLPSTFRLDVMGVCFAAFHF
jgi:hypothetical protein